MPRDVNAIATAFNRIAQMPSSSLVSEEDVKNKAVLPMLRALGYDESDFNYERRTGRGYVDIVVEHFPTGIIVEAKAPKRRLEEHTGQVEDYVFQKYRHGRATLAILTNGELFNVYGVTEALVKGSLDKYRIKSFNRSALGESAVQAELTDLLGRQNNLSETIPQAIFSAKKRRDRLEPIENELRELHTERQRIDARIRELEGEQSSLLKIPSIESTPDEHKTRKTQPKPSGRGVRGHERQKEIVFNFLVEHGADSERSSVERKWIDQQLVGKVDDMGTAQDVSFGLIVLRQDGLIKWEKGRCGCLVG